MDQSPEEKTDLEMYAAQHRGALLLNDDQEVLLAVAWVLPIERHQFHLFPCIVHIDSTMCTNKEGRPLLTMSGRDSSGNQFIFFRAFLPNECAWVFKWVFQNVMPTLFGKDALKRIVLFVTDGDQQLSLQLDLATEKYFPNTYRAAKVWKQD